MEMRKVLAFLLWLFSLWTWKDLFLRWLRRAPVFRPSGGETAGSEHLSSEGGEQDSEWGRFLSSLPEDERWCRVLDFLGDSDVRVSFGSPPQSYKSDLEAGYRDFLGAVASSEVVFREVVEVIVEGDDCFKHVEAFADALRQYGNAVRILVLQFRQGSAIPVAKCVSNALLGNDAIQDLRLYFGGKIMGKLVAAEVVAIVAVPHIPRILKSLFICEVELDGEGMKQLMKPFKGSFSVLENLSLGRVTSDAALEHISDMLATNTSLKTLDFSLRSQEQILERRDKKSFVRGFTGLASALSSNQCLRKLRCDPLGGMELRASLDPLMPKPNNLQPNTTLTRLTLRGSVGGKEGIETLVGLIRTNTSLLGLDLWGLEEFRSGDPEATEHVLAILGALKTNTSLKDIGFENCPAVGGSQVLGTMMDLLLQNQSIERIRLVRTGLWESGDAGFVESALSKRRKMRLWDVVRGMANVKPTSGRVFLCGQPLAGKTTLRLSMKKLEEFQDKEIIQSTSRIRKIGKALKRVVVPTELKEDLPPDRTRGIEVDTVHCDGIDITIWDMAGQTDYHSFHELVMPNFSADGSCSTFLLMCDPMTQLDSPKRRKLASIRAELEYWLRFIASNTRRSDLYRSHVSIVMTHFDHWKDDHAFAKRIEEEVLELKAKFQGVLEFDEDEIVFKVNGEDILDARKVFDFIKSHLHQLLERLPLTLGACQEVQRLVVQWNADKSNPSLLKWDEFCEKMCKDVEDFKDANLDLAQRRKEFVALSLSDGGHIIYDEKEGVVITNPHWFCHDVMGQFLHQCAEESGDLIKVLANGMVSIDHVKDFMWDLVDGEGDFGKKFDDILSVMKKLHVCYEQDAGLILIPSTLRDTNETLSWFQSGEHVVFKYVGRRLACQDGVKTMLTVGFFTRLQVLFFEILESSNEQSTYQVFRDVIRFSTDGVDVILQFNHGDIDILSRSDQSQDKMLGVLESNIIKHIRDLQEDLTLGCPGVRLTQFIFRPACVEKLLSPPDHKRVFVHASDLELEVVMYGADAKHYWGVHEGCNLGSDKVRTLLGDLAYQSLLDKRTRNLKRYMMKLQSLDPSKDFFVEDDPSFHHSKHGDLSTSSFWELPWTREIRALRAQVKSCEVVVSSKLDVVIDMIRGLEVRLDDIQKDLLPKVCSRMDDLMALTVEMQKSQIPKVAYLCEVGSPKLLTRFVPGLDRIKLHLMCESIGGFHRVASQEGCVVNFGTEDTRRFLAMVAYGLKVVTILTKIGAHVTCGMGAMVPDFSHAGTFPALILDSSGILDFQIPTSTLESLPMEARGVSRLPIDETSEAQLWLQSILEPRVHNKGEFFAQFKLRRVKYRSPTRKSIAWICAKCLSKQGDPMDVLD